MIAGYISFIIQTAKNLSVAEYLLIFSSYIFLFAIHSFISLYLKEARQHLDGVLEKIFNPNSLFPTIQEILILPPGDGTNKTVNNDTNVELYPISFIDDDDQINTPYEPVYSTAYIEDSIDYIKSNYNQTAPSSNQDVIKSAAEVAPFRGIQLNNTAIYFEQRGTAEESLSDLSDLDVAVKDYLQKENCLVLMNFDSNDDSSESLDDLFHKRISQDDLICKGIYPGIDLATCSGRFFNEPPNNSFLDFFTDFTAQYKHVVIFLRPSELSKAKDFMKSYLEKEDVLVSELSQTAGASTPHFL